jgi:hypothetical protein
MNPRYFVKYRRWDGTSTVTSTRVLGRFGDQESAESDAKKRFAVSGSEIINVRHETRPEAAVHRILRFAIRALRITCAVVIALTAYAWMYEPRGNIGNVPLGSLTLNMLFSSIFHVALVVAAGWLCWVLAFGDGPKD